MGMTCLIDSWNGAYEPGGEVKATTAGTSKKADTAFHGMLEKNGFHR